MRFSNKLVLSDWNCRTPFNGCVEFRREQVRLHRDTQIRSMHEMREIKRAQELRVDKFSTQKLRESHDTIQRLTDDFLNDSGEFLEVESNYGGKIHTFPVNQQGFQVHALCTWNLFGPQENVFTCPHSTLESTQTPYRGILHSTTPSATGEVPMLIFARKDENLKTWNPSGVQEYVSANPRSTLESLQIPRRGIHPFMTPNAAGEAPALIRKGKLVARDKERIGNTIPMPTSASRPSTMNSFMPVI